MAGLGGGLHEGVVGRDVGRRRVARRRGDEQQPELGAGGNKAYGLERPGERHRVGAVCVGCGALHRRLRLRPGWQNGQQGQREQRSGEDGAQKAGIGAAGRRRKAQAARTGRPSRCNCGEMLMPVPWTQDPR